MEHSLQNDSPTEFISRLYLHSDFADIHFLFNNDGEIVQVPAHKSILAIGSPVFAAMLFGPLKENQVVEIVDANQTAFKEFLQFFYRSQVTLTMQNIESVARLADKYDVIDCLNACTTFLGDQLNEDNMIWSYQLAISLNNRNMKQSCEHRIRLFIGDALESDAFLHCDREVLKHILLLDSMNCEEIDLFQPCIKWAKLSCQESGLNDNDSENLKKQLDDCFYLIRFGTMTHEEFCTILTNELYKNMFTRNELVEIICSKSKSIKNFTGQWFNHVQRIVERIEWDDKKTLLCTPLLPSTTKYTLQGQESTWFSTNFSVLLGTEIICGSLENYSSSYIDITSKVSVVEHNQHMNTSKTLFTGEITFEGKEPVDSSITLPQPIVIRQKKVYEIRLQFASLRDQYYYHTETRKSEVKLDERTTVTFHKMLSSSESRGLVTTLHFNPI